MFNPDCRAMDVSMETEDCTPPVTSNSYQNPSQAPSRQLLPQFPENKSIENPPPVNQFNSDGLKRKRGGLNINYLADCKRRKI